MRISIEEHQAELIRQHAERAGMDVPAYLVHAAVRQIAETEAQAELPPEGRPDGAAVLDAPDVHVQAV